MLAEGAYPPWRIASRKSGEYPATSEMVEHCDIFGELHRIDSRQIHAQLPDAHRLGVLGHEIVPEQGVRRGFDSLDLKVLFGHAKAPVTKSFCKLHLFLDTVHQDLKASGVGSSQLNSFMARSHVRDNEDSELHFLLAP